MLKKPLAEEVLFGRLSKAGGQVDVSIVDGEVSLDIEEAVPALPVPA